MKIKEILKNLDYTAFVGNTDKAANLEEMDITAVVRDNRKIVPGCLFICIEGANFDGHSAAAEAFEKGAACIVTEKAEQYIIYADTCTIDEQTRAKLNIIFKKIPRDIRRF